MRFQPVFRTGIGDRVERVHEAPDTKHFVSQKYRHSSGPAVDQLSEHEVAVLGDRLFHGIHLLPHNLG